MSIGTSIRQIVTIYVVLEDGSGRELAAHVQIRDAFIIAEAFEYRGLKVIIDPPTFGLMMNTISWGPTDNPPRAVPWRDYLEERAKHETTRETWNELYEYTPAGDWWSGYEHWEVPNEQ